MVLNLVCEGSHTYWFISLPLRPHPSPASYILRIDDGDLEKDGIDSSLSSSTGRAIVLTANHGRAVSIAERFAKGKKAVIRIIKDDNNHIDGSFDLSSFRDLAPEIKAACGW